MLYQRPAPRQSRRYRLRRKRVRGARPRILFRLRESAVRRNVEGSFSGEANRHHRGERIGYRRHPPRHVFEPFRQVPARKFFLIRKFPVLPLLPCRMLRKPIRGEHHRRGMRRQPLRSRNHAVTRPILTFAVPNLQSRNPKRTRAFGVFGAFPGTLRRPRIASIHPNGIRRTQFLFVEGRTLPHSRGNR